MLRDQYVTELEQMLQDRTVHKLTNRNPENKYQAKVNNLIDTLKKSVAP